MTAEGGAGRRAGAPSAAVEDAAGAAPAELAALYRDAFPDEDLAALAAALTAAPDTRAALIARGAGGALIGHVAFSACRLTPSGAAAALLGPLAVAPAAQRRGVGSALVRAGLRRMVAAGVARVFVLGDPAYYGRFGFEPDARVAPPYPIPPAWAPAWRSIRAAPAPALGGAPLAEPSAERLEVPPLWRRPELWAP
ncbi:MAG: GNAT family N-acetyltransferase [Pseudomonadota bacterium]